MADKRKNLLALFYCANTPGGGESERRALERTHGESIRLFPLPCSGRLDQLHLLRALEEFADAAYLITCPEGECRYFEGNTRAVKRVEMAKDMIAGIGLERERLGIVVNEKGRPKTLGEIAAELMDRIAEMEPSPVFGRRKVPSKRATEDKT